VLAESEAVSFMNSDDPKQGHIALTEQENEMSVMWNSKHYGTSVVYYGLVREELNYTEFNFNAKTYEAGDLCGSPANQTNQESFRKPGWFHTVTLSNLIPNTTYFYKFGTPHIGYFSLIYSFRTPSSSQADIGTIFVAYADQDVGGWMEEQRWDQKEDPKDGVKLIKKWIDHIDFIIHPGDISYALGVGFVWDLYMNLVCLSLSCFIFILLNLILIINFGFFALRFRKLQPHFHT
jgi:hypothetical protein